MRMGLLSRWLTAPLHMLLLGWGALGAGACVFYNRQNDAAQACAAYADATCQAWQRCNQALIAGPYESLDGCRRELARTCTQTLTAEDVLASADGARACGEVMSQLTCSEVVSGAPPPACRAPSGLRSDGAICSLAAQCASTRCAKVTVGDAYGWCSELGTSGQYCLAEADCSEGLECTANQVCMAPVKSDPDATCGAFGDAMCARLAACSTRLVESAYGGMPACASRVASNCWYSLHAPDAASSAMGVAGCIGLLPQMECGALLGNRWPEACRIAPGTRAAGQVCSVDAQCDTTRCMRASETACGSCAPLATAEQPCRASSDCSAGLACSQDGKCRAPGAPGNACDLQHACAYGVSCASGSCVPALGQGAQCKLDSDSCDRYAGLACGATSARCEPWPVFAMTPAGSTFDFQAPEGCP